MAKFSSWVHGVNVISQRQSDAALLEVEIPQGNGLDNTNVLGYPDSGILNDLLSSSIPGLISKTPLSGKVFRLQQKQENTFMCAVPTPTTISDVRPTLQRVMILFAVVNVEVSAIFLADGPNLIGTYATNGNNPIGTTGVNGPVELVEGNTAFSAQNFLVLPGAGSRLASFSFNWGMNVIVDATATKDGGLIFFTSVGADFDA